MKSLIRLWLLPVISICFLASCSTSSPPAASVSEYTREVEKNYELNVPMQRFVGDKIISRKDFFSRLEYRNDTVRSSASFRLERWCLGTKRSEFEYNDGEVLRVTEVKTMEGRDYRVILAGVYGGTNWLFAIDEKGTIRGDKVYAGKSSPVATCKWVISPSDVVLKTFTKMEVNKDKPYLNYDIIYTGRSGGVINLVYREYTPDDLAKPAFYQNLTYDVASPLIRFRNLQIRVSDATNQEISYTVLSD
jgi:hypothetical protein